MNIPLPNTVSHSERYPLLKVPNVESAHARTPAVTEET